MGSVIQYNLQARWTPLGAKATKRGALSGTPMETLAFICEEKEQRRWGEKGKLTRRKAKDGSDIKQHMIKDPNQGG